MVSRHGAHKVCACHGAHKGVHKGAHKGIACAHLVPAGHAKDMVRTMVRTGVPPPGAHKRAAPGAHNGAHNGGHKGAHKALRVKGIFASHHVFINMYTQ